jgi:transcriptional regulator
LSDQTDVLQGTLDLLILRTIALEPAQDSARDIPAEPSAGRQSFLPRFARLRPLRGTQRAGASRNESHSGRMHGWAIAQRIQQMSDGLLRVQQGSLYPALHRLEHQGWITAEWGTSENNRRARFYALTKAGRKQVEAEVAKWERLSAGVNLVLQRT